MIESEMHSTLHRSTMHCLLQIIIVAMEPIVPNLDIFCFR